MPPELNDTQASSMAADATTSAPAAPSTDGQAPLNETAPADAGATPAATPADEPGDGSTATAPSLLEELAKKKGWDPAKAPELLAQSYTELETKLGGFSEIERKAQLSEQLQTELAESKTKAEAWDAAQRYLESVGADGKPDLAKMSVKDLSILWQKGQIGLAEVPAQLQFQVQQFVQATQQAQDRVIQSQASDLVKNNPILNDPDVMEFVATKIEQGTDPQQAVASAKRIWGKAEKSVEERFKRDTEAIKKGNMERGGSPVATKPVQKISTVADAFRAAKTDLGMK